MIRRICLISIMAAFLLLLASCRQVAKVRLLEPGLAHAAAAVGPDPTATISGPSEVTPGGIAVFTVTVAVPTTETQTATSVVASFAPNTTYLTATSATAPAMIAASATMTADGASPVTSNTIYVRVLGKTATVAPVSGKWVDVPVGNLAPGQSAQIVCTCSVKP